MTRFPKPCLSCGQITSGANYCAFHQAARESFEQERQRARKAGRTLYRSADYQRRSKAIRESATVCHLCGEGARLNDPWTADHLIAGDVASPLAPAHRSCNSARGNKPLDK